MQIRGVLLAAALVLAPLSARGADLVVWWEQGYLDFARDRFMPLMAKLV